eukprot:880204-Prorocentrum_lima.AAC.1
MGLPFKYATSFSPATMPAGSPATEPPVIPGAPLASISHVGCGTSRGPAVLSSGKFVCADDEIREDDA